MGPFGQELKHVLRSLARTPMFAIVTVIAITLGIGANTAVFSVIKRHHTQTAALSAPRRTDERDADRAGGVGIADCELAPSDYFTFREENQTFQQFGIWNGDRSSITGTGSPEQVRSIDVTALADHPPLRDQAGPIAQNAGFGGRRPAQSPSRRLHVKVDYSRPDDMLEAVRTRALGA